MTGLTKLRIGISDFKEGQKLLDSQCYIDGDYLVLNVRYEYDIALSRISSHADILDWVLHLSGKNWFSMELMQRFISLAKSTISIG
jgi:hypothetical protein